MSKLDNIILECANKVLDGKEEKLGDYIDPTKQKIKELFIELVDDSTPEGSYHVNTDVLRQKVEEL